MEITFNLPHVFSSSSSSLEDAHVLRALLDCLVNINRAYLREHPFTKPLYESGVVYGRTQLWEPIPALYARGFGDCKSLSAAFIAEQAQRTGRVPKIQFRWIKRENDGGKDFHILVQMPDGSYVDPSRKLGMMTYRQSPFLLRQG